MIQRADDRITEEAAADFVARITSHIPVGDALQRPLLVNSESAPGIPAVLLTGDPALWTLTREGTRRFLPTEGNKVEVVEFRNGVEYSRAIHGFG